MVDELEQVFSDNRRGPLGREKAPPSRERTQNLARAQYRPRDLLFKRDFFYAAEYLLESAAIGNVLSSVSRGDVPNLEGNV